VRHVLTTSHKGNLLGPRGNVRAMLRQAAVQTTSRQSQAFVKGVKNKVRAAGLGRLQHAIGETSSLKKRRTTGDPFGVVFAYGGEFGRAQQALYAYTTGVTIRARNQEWLAFQTNAIPRRAGPNRKRMTPALYKSSGYEQSLGKLIFKPIGPNRALLVIQNVTLQPRTGRARPAGKRPPRTRVFKKETPAFILIRSTRRGRRVDDKTLAKAIANQGPRWAGEEMEKIMARAGFL
jgi:hypothetical protein